MVADPVPILMRFQTAATSMPKHARLRDAFVEAIAAGELPAGTKVMGERDLSRALGVSLGTTQKALNRLTDEGFLVRRQGHGTFVGTHRRAITGSWHARFVGPDGAAELPVFATLVERRLVMDEGPWSLALGHDPKGYVMIARCLDVGAQFICASQLYLPASRFSRLLRMAERRLADINLKLVLAGDFSAPTLHSEGFATVVAITPDDAALMGLAPNSAGLQVHIIGYSFGRVPITFQRLLVPPTDCAMKLDFNPPGARPDAPGP